MVTTLSEISRKIIVEEWIEKWVHREGRVDPIDKLAVEDLVARLDDLVERLGEAQAAEAPAVTVKSEPAKDASPAAPKPKTVKKRAKSKSSVGGLSTPEAAQFIGCKTHILLNHRRAGTGPAYHKKNGRIFYKKKELLEWIESKSTNVKVD